MSCCSLLQALAAKMRRMGKQGLDASFGRWWRSRCDAITKRVGYELTDLLAISERCGPSRPFAFSLFCTRITTCCPFRVGDRPFCFSTNITAKT